MFFLLTVAHFILTRYIASVANGQAYKGIGGAQKRNIFKYITPFPLKYPNHTY